MPRNLPWLKKGAKVTQSPEKASKRNLILSSDLEDTRNDETIVRHSNKKQRTDGRTPSTSPPPSPPQQEPMKEGLHEDDIWMMVEDEFLSTARIYTQHLHHAEYQRLKQLVNEQDSCIAQEISRPVDPRANLSKEMKIKTQGKALTTAQQDGMKTLQGNESPTKTLEDLLDEEFEDPWIKDSSLAGLLSSSQVESSSLDGLICLKSNTRAAAGYQKQENQKPQETQNNQTNQSHPGSNRPRDNRSTSLSNRPKIVAIDTDSTDNEDDLDYPPVSKFQKQPSKSPLPTESNINKLPKKMSLRDGILSKESAREMNSRSKIFSTWGSTRTVSSAHQASSPYTKPESKRNEEANNSSHVSKSSKHSTALTQRTAKRKADLAKRDREEKEKSVLLDEIPMFLV